MHKWISCSAHSPTRTHHTRTRTYVFLLVVVTLDGHLTSLQELTYERTVRILKT